MPPHPPLAIALIGALLAAQANAQPAWVPKPAPRATPLGAPSAPLTYRTIDWDALIPAGWDGMKDFRKLDLASMQDGDARATDVLKRMRQAWDRAPVNTALIGQPVRLPGYVVPLEESPEGVKEFLLVPYHGACIHTPPPPANQIVHVIARAPVKVKSMDTVFVSGVMAYTRSDTYMGVSSWQLPATLVEPYGEALKAVPLR